MPAEVEGVHLGGVCGVQVPDGLVHSWRRASFRFCVRIFRSGGVGGYGTGLQWSDKCLLANEASDTVQLTK